MSGSMAVLRELLHHNTIKVIQMSYTALGNQQTMQLWKYSILICSKLCIVYLKARLN